MVSSIFLSENFGRKFFQPTVCTPFTKPTTNSFSRLIKRL